ncbi:gluconate 2-dehydrogenase subunit 3 family protein [Marivirga salinae]|uniref:Gluconate 2-dehydrogenase subunit 3 family protein n=1 Tax=Marivirga salinarum TaxID=3059078 RepID=A0AA51N9K4_9BACT|nr:gluconate 2-dehydrogenase subunit 3 family protein [Marivirga sp. BDSF4-3]WMN11317.1 gluconate 2-dehydrogenase subunit 3 family protein [Marivirga sp. BDSF4-3]
MNRREAIKKTGLALGFAATSPLLMHLIQSCESKKPLGWKPQFFDEKQALLVAALANQILPKTDTPGALDVGVDVFVDKMVAEVYSEKEQKQFLKGLEEIEKNSESKNGKIFTDLESKVQYDFLYGLENEVKHLSFDSDPKEKPFFLMLKELVLLGYFTSEEIMTKHLDYQPVPGQLLGCEPMKANQKLRVGNYF